MTTLQQVHVRVNDFDSGKPTPCRVRFTNEKGTYFAPLGRLKEFATTYGVDVGGSVILDGKKYAYIDGTCEIALPPGIINIEVHKGPEYKPLYVEHHLAAGKLSLRLTLTRLMDLRKYGWYSGDARAHFLTPHAALLEGMAEDLAVVNLLAVQERVAEVHDTAKRILATPWAISNLLAFSGQKPALEAPGHMVVVNTCNWHPYLGRVSLLNCHRPVYPIRFGEPDGDDWTIADWCDQCHRKKGLVVWSGPDKHLSEVLADAILGKVDAIEIDSSMGDENQGADVWGWLAQLGIDLPYVGASGKTSNTELLGGLRTYAHLKPDEPLSYGAWIEAVRDGRTFLTKGPLINMHINGQDIAKVIDVPAASSDIRLDLQVVSASPFHRVEVLYPGGEVSVLAKGSPPTAAIGGQIQLESSGWIMATCFAAEGDDQAPVAFTSPIRIRLEGHPFERDSERTQLMRDHLQTVVKRLRAEGRFATDANRERLLGVFDKAMAVLQSS